MDFLYCLVCLREILLHKKIKTWKKFRVVTAPVLKFRVVSRPPCPRLAARLAPAPAIFQQLVDNLVSGIPYVAAYQDDVIVTGRTKEEHLQNLKQGLAALTEYGMKLRLDKCEFFRQQVTYVGHVISADGLKPSEERVDAIVKIPTPDNVKQLESFIGKLNYYGKFLPSFSCNHVWPSKPTAQTGR